MLDRVLPADAVGRALTWATAATSLANGLFYSVSVLYFTRVIGLSAATVGIGLTVAGAVGVAASYAGGHASDRWGADRVQLWATAGQAAALLAYLAADGVVAFVAVACAAVGLRSLQRTARLAVLARWYVGAERVGVRARLRVVTNVGIGVGTCLAGFALLVDTAAAYRTTMLLVGLLCLGATVPLARVRRRVPDLATRMRPPPAVTDVAPATNGSPLRDRTYVSAVVLTSVMSLNMGIQVVGVPLWVADHTEAPEVMIAVLLVLNTAVVAGFQVRAARGTDDVAVAGRAVRRGGGMLALAAVLFAASGDVGALAAVPVLVAAELASSTAEVWAEAGAWGLAFELADPARAGAYQGVHQTGEAVAAMLAPLVITATAIRHGTVGWLVLGAVFLVAGLLAAELGRRVAPQRTAAPG